VKAKNAAASELAPTLALALAGWESGAGAVGAVPLFAPPQPLICNLFLPALRGPFRSDTSLSLE